MATTASGPTVYIVGDAGYNEFACSDTDRLLRVPTGVLFMRNVLPDLLGSPFSVETLVSTAAVKSERPIASATPTRKATLSAYNDIRRISSYAPPSRSQRVCHLWYCQPKSPPPAHRILVAHHAGETWSVISPALSTLITSLTSSDSTATDWPCGGLPSVIVNLSTRLPELRPDASILDQGPFRSPLWNLLYRNRVRTGIVLSISAFLDEGGAISRRHLSWEQGVEDFVAELHLFPRLGMLSRFRHLFIRVGMVGFIHLQYDEGAASAYKLSGHVYFAPYVEDGIYRDSDLEGNTIGKNTILIAALARAGHALSSRTTAPGLAAEPPAAAPPPELRDAFTRALQAMRAVDDKGYEPEHFGKASGADAGRQLIQASMAHAAPILTGVSAPPTPGDVHTLSWRPIPSHLLFPPPPNALRFPQRWRILDDVLLEAPIHRINIAMAMVKAGHDRVLNRVWRKSDSEGPAALIWNLLTRVEYWNPRDRAPDYVTLEDDDWPATPHPPDGKKPATPPVLGDISEFELNVPVTTFKGLTLIERDEMETLRGISNLLKLYHTQAAKRASGEAFKPISIAVFGPPGSGKSFAVKEIAKALGSDKIAPRLEFNVAQFRSLDDLAAAFKRVAQATNNGAPTIPLVFFDEFDCAWDSRELGWLKYFLAPMQDGTFQNSDQQIGPAIFVFAGGLRESFEEFDPTTDAAYDNRRDSEEYKRRLQSFVDQKGPDFTSRLRGHINVLSINDAAGRVKHFIRRSLQLRGVLNKAGHVDKDGVARIDDAIVYALLTVDHYHHGVRSMQAIVEMCAPVFGRIQIASLPPRAQLDMHVDAEEFLIRVHRGRVRAQPEWKPNPAAEYDWAVRLLRENIEAAARERPDDVLIEALKKALGTQKDRA